MPTSITGLIHLLLDKLERDHGKILISHALGYIPTFPFSAFYIDNSQTLPPPRMALPTASLRMFYLAMMKYLIAFTFGNLLNHSSLSFIFNRWTPPLRRLPPLIWCRARDDIDRYLIERGSDGYMVYSWYALIALMNFH